MQRIKRKAYIVSVYYYEKDPVIELEDWDDPNYLFLNDVIDKAMRKHNPDSDILDVAIDETKPALFSVEHSWSRYLYRLLRR